MDKGTVAVEAAFAADDQPLEAQQPGDAALDDPAVPVAPQLAAVLPTPSAGPEVWRDEVDPPAMQPLPQRATVVAAIGHQAPGLHLRPARPRPRDGDLGERRLGELTLGHRGSCQANSER